MKPSLLTKRIVSGLMASAFLALTACDNSSLREVKATLGKKAEQQAQEQIDKSTPCTSEILKMAADRLKPLNEITGLIDISKQQKLTTEQISRLKALVDELKSATDKLVEQIEKTKSPQGKNITGCMRTNATNPKLSELYSIATFRNEDVRVARVVSALTQESNSILDAAQNNPDLLAHSTLTENQIYLIKTDLADALSEANLDGRMYILDGRVFTGTEAATQLTQLKAQTTQSFCFLQATLGKLQTDTAMKLTSMRSQVLNDGASSSSLLVFTGESSQMFTLQCKINSLVSETPSQIRLVLGDLIQFQQSEASENSPAEPTAHDSTVEGEQSL